MKLHLADTSGRNVVSGYGPGFIEINGERHGCALVVGPEHLDTNWMVSDADAIDADAMVALASLRAEIVLIGTGARQRFPAPAALRPLIEAGIGYEVMDTRAACRTYNILVAEDRKVLAALIP